MISIKHTEIVAIIDWLMNEANDQQVEALYQILINEDIYFVKDLFRSYIYDDFIKDIKEE